MASLLSCSTRMVDSKPDSKVRYRATCCCDAHSTSSLATQNSRLALRAQSWRARSEIRDKFLCAAHARRNMMKSKLLLHEPSTISLQHCVPSRRLPILMRSEVLRGL